MGGSSLELGELEQLTINNDNDLNYDQITAPKVNFLPLYINFVKTSCPCTVLLFVMKTVEYAFEKTVSREYVN